MRHEECWIFGAELWKSLCMRREQKCCFDERHKCDCALTFNYKLVRYLISNNEKITQEWNRFKISYIYFSSAKFSARILPQTELMRLGGILNHSHRTFALLCLTSISAHQRSTYSLLVAARHPARSEYPLRWQFDASSLVLFLRELSMPSSSLRATSATMTMKAWSQKKQWDIKIMAPK